MGAGLPAGAKGPHVAYILIYLVFAYFVLRWNRGVLPVIAAFAVVLRSSRRSPAWPGSTATRTGSISRPRLRCVGLICWLIVPVQVLLIAFCAQGFAQAWNVEVERHRATGRPVTATG